MKEWIVAKTDLPKLNQFLLEQCPSLQPGRLHKYLRENKIKVNGKKQPLSFHLAKGDQVRLYLPDDAFAPASGPVFLQARNQLCVVYEDAEVLVVDKPAGLIVSSEDKKPDTLIHRALRYLFEHDSWKPADPFTPSLCHRLDTGTSGIVLIAKTSSAHLFLTQLIKDRAVTKRYLCVTFGRPQPPDCTLTGYLLKDAAKAHVRVISGPQPGAKEIITQYRTLAVSGRLALLDVTLITGRTHQIRAHLAFIGCPVLGDSKYGNNSANRELRFKYQALCAHSVTFPHIAAGNPCCELSGKTLRTAQPWYVKQVLDIPIQ